MECCLFYLELKFLKWPLSGRQREWKRYGEARLFPVVRNRFIFK